VINKTVTNEEILDRAELIFSSGIESLKLYYMIGLPTEQDEDLVAIRDLTVQLREIMLKHARARGRIGRIVASVNPLVPKPGTTYQWLPMEATSIERKMKRLHALVSGTTTPSSISTEAHSLPGTVFTTGVRAGHRAPKRTAASGGGVAETGIDATSTSFAIVGRHRAAVDIIDAAAVPSSAASSRRARAEWPLPPSEPKKRGPFRSQLPSGHTARA
jgi:hypothetical protein